MLTVAGKFVELVKHVSVNLGLDTGVTAPKTRTDWIDDFVTGPQDPALQAHHASVCATLSF